MKGSCLCGAVAFEVDKIPESYRACHCTACRKSGGHYWSAFSVANDDFRFTEDRGLKWYRSSDWAERGFCKVCGGNLFYHMLKEDRYMMAVGAFDDQSGFELQRQVFIDEKPGFYDLAPLNMTSTGDDFFTRYPALKGKG